MTLMYRGKRTLDLVLVLVSLPVWLPALLVIALLVRVRLGSPVFFRQRRAGLHGAPFLMIKFRTMTNACAADGSLLPDAERLPPFGVMLRSTSMDELPELLNVLRGDMSIVGPRPLHDRYLPRYSREHARRHDVRPGLTGLAQVSGRNGLSWPERFDWDVAYVDSQSLLSDLRIIYRTIRVVFTRSGVAAGEEPTAPEFTGYGSAPVKGVDDALTARGGRP